MAAIEKRSFPNILTLKLNCILIEHLIYVSGSQTANHFFQERLGANHMKISSGIGF